MEKEKDREVPVYKREAEEVQGDASCDRDNARMRPGSFCSLRSFRERCGNLEIRPCFYSGIVFEIVKWNPDTEIKEYCFVVSLVHLRIPDTIEEIYERISNLSAEEMEVYRSLEVKAKELVREILEEENEQKRSI